jgi:hypothetical protein
MGFREKEIGAVVILKAFQSEQLQNQIYALLQQFEIIDLQYSTTNLTNRQSSVLVEYSALVLIGHKLPEQKKPETVNVLNYVPKEGDNANLQSKND